MQTFIISPYYQETAEILDNRRLNKQITEAGQLIDIISGKKDYYKNHPATRMWFGHLCALKLYYNMMLEVWLSRGKKYKNSPFVIFGPSFSCHIPSWILDSRIHETHKQRLCQKDFDFYKPKFPELVFDSTVDYLWPVFKNDKLGMEYVNKMVNKNKYKIEFEGKDYYLTRLVRKVK